MTQSVLVVCNRYINAVDRESLHVASTCCWKALIHHESSMFILMWNWFLTKYCRVNTKVGTIPMIRHSHVLRTIDSEGLDIHSMLDRQMLVHYEFEPITSIDTTAGPTVNYYLAPYSYC